MSLLIPELERQLRAAARERQLGALEPGRRPRWRGRVLFTALAALPALAVAAAALVLVGHRSVPTTGGRTHAASRPSASAACPTAPRGAPMRVAGGSVAGLPWALWVPVGERGLRAFDAGELVLGGRSYPVCGSAARDRIGFALIDAPSRGVVFGYVARPGVYTIGVRSSTMPAQTVELGWGTVFVVGLPNSACAYPTLSVSATSPRTRSTGVTTTRFGACRPGAAAAVLGSRTSPWPSAVAKPPFVPAPRLSPRGTPWPGAPPPGLRGGGANGSPELVSQINLRPPRSGSAAGVAQVVRQGSRYGIVIVGRGVMSNRHDAYAVWLTKPRAGGSKLLGFVNPAVRANGQLRSAGLLPADAARYRQILITLETTPTPRAPGKIVLEGRLKLR